MSTLSHAEDIRLVKAAQEGDAEAFGSLYERHAGAIFRFLYAHMSNRQDAEDLTEEVFLKVWRALPGYREQGVPFQAYLFRVARHALIDTYRRAGKMQEPVSTEDLVIQDTGLEPPEAVVEKLDQEQVRRALRKLREEYRTVLVMRYLLDFSAEETAQAMSRTPGAVRVLQHRALSTLRVVLKEL